MSIIKVNGDDITVFDRISSRDKIDIINLSVDAAKESEGIYNPCTLDVYFHTYLVLLYTDIKVTNEERNDILSLYDSFVEKGILDQVIDAIDDTEYNNLVDWTTEYVEDRIKKELSFAGIVDNFIQTMPEKAQEAANILEGVNPESVENVTKLLTDMKELGMK